MLILDLRAFRAAPDSSPLPRQARAGALKDIRTENTTALKWQGKTLERFSPTSPEAMTVALPPGAEVEASYTDGTPAAFRLKLDKGKVIVFAVRPFVDSRAAVVSSGWREYFARLLNEHRIPAGLPHWEFLLP